MKIIVFKVFDKFLGIDIMDVVEVIDRKTTTRVPNSSKYVEGLFSLRGDIITLFNSYRLLESRQERDYKNIIVLEKGEEKIGLMAEEILEIINIDGDDIRDTPSGIEGVIGSIKIRDEVINIIDGDILTSKKEG